jgi:Pyridoxamine 5'-phosphate oxidase
VLGPRLIRLAVAVAHGGWSQSAILQQALEVHQMTQTGGPARQLRTQRRGRRIAMTEQERDAFLTEERTCRVATIGPDGPHVTPLWFHWDGTALWISSVVRSQRWADLMKDPRVAVTIDAGHDYGELRGVEILGTVEVVGPAPRNGEPVAALEAIEPAFSRKYTGDPVLDHDGRHGWLKVVPGKITSWDFRKLAP